MKRSSKNRFAGNLHKGAGTFKRVAGQIVNDPGLEAEGKSENLAGKIQRGVGQVEKALGK